MGIVTLSLPGDLQAIVDDEVAFGAFADREAFVEALIRQHRERKLAALIERSRRASGAG